MSALSAIFFASGVAGLFYEIVFAKSLALIFGSTSDATTTVLATYMGGLALGAWIGGWLSGRVRNLLRAYALCELAIGVICAASPLTLHAVRSLYVAAAGSIDPGAAVLLALRVALGALALLPPTLLMGMTLPLLLQRLSPDARSIGRGVGLLYGANTLGASLGALAAGFVVLPALGILRTTIVAVVLNCAAALAALRLNPPSTVPPTRPPPPSETQPAIGLAVLGLGGALSFALEVVCTHLLAVVAGNSAYAFALMLFCFLVGLGIGAALTRGRAHPLTLLALLEFLLALLLLGTVFLWDRMPSWFEHAPVRSFAGRELYRFAVCVLAMVPPAICIGALYPLAMSCVGAGASADAGPVAGRASALNTAGNVAGALLGGFVLLPRLGSLRLIQLIAAGALALGVCAALAGRRRALALVGVLAAGALFALQPRTFDLDRLASGANVYFMPDPLDGHVIDHAESLDGGLTTVVESRQRDGRPLYTLRTNGKFQGDNGAEVPAQLGFALEALLHVAKRDAALVIGFGTGTTPSVVERAGFQRVDVVELSADVLALADRHFREVNQGVLEKPAVHVHVTDGRNYLLLSRRSYDFIGIEVTSIWFAGAAALYNREFYRLARARLNPGGVLQQWVQLHHMYLEDFATILATARAEFGKIWFYIGRSQGMIIACESGCAPSRETLARLSESAALAPALARLRGFDGLLQNRLLDPDGVDRFLAAFAARGVDPESLLSDDDNLLLEYSTPRGNVLGFQMTPITDALEPFVPASPLDGTLLR